MKFSCFYALIATVTAQQLYDQGKATEVLPSNEFLGVDGHGQMNTKKLGKDGHEKQNKWQKNREKKNEAFMNTMDANHDGELTKTEL